MPAISKKILLVFTLFTLPALLFSQKKDAASPAAKDTAIANLFDKPAAVKWVKYFKGRVDDVATVDIALGSDGKNCRGWLSYAKSRDRLRLDGTLNGDTLRLEERNGKTLTGNLRGTYTNRRLEAEWTNHNNSLGSRLEANELAPGQTLNIGCSDGKWASRYITRYNNARCDMILIRMHNGSLFGYLWVEADAKTYDLRGEIDREGNYEIEALSSSDKIAGLLQGNLANPQKTDCNWVGSGEKRSFNFVQKDNFQLGCYEYADFQSSYDALYPRTPCGSCNTWLDQQVNNWTNKCKSVLSAKKTSSSPASRSAQRASCWAEIACLTENIFSGYLTFSESWEKQASGQAFNFDLRTGKPVTFNELFNKSFNAKGWLDDFAKKEMPKLAHFANDPEYRAWVAKEGFPMFTLRRDGLELSTLFHGQYGRQTLLVPYLSLKPYMKKDNPIADFVK